MGSANFQRVMLALRLIFTVACLQWIATVTTASGVTKNECTAAGEGTSKECSTNGVRNGATPGIRLPRRQWRDMTTEDFRQLNSEECIAILPVAAIEQHGPHLPVSVDSLLNEGVLNRALELLSEDMPVTVLPMMPIGKSNEHLAYPGTLSLGVNTLISLWTDIGESVARAGIRKLILFNSHGGQPQVMDIVARDLRVRLKMFVVTLNWFSFGMPEGIFPEEELKHGIHGGAIETSLMMHLRPDLVKTHLAENFAPTSVEFEKQFTLLSAEGAVGFGWQTQDLHPSGACGNATLASAEKGKQILDYAARKLVKLLEEVKSFPLSNLKDGPLDSSSVLADKTTDSPTGNGNIDPKHLDAKNKNLPGL